MAAVLNSWKEIACYLSRGVRTVQRWEREQHLPVHRIGLGSRAPVFAYEAELRVWQQSFREDKKTNDFAKSFPPSKWAPSRSGALERHRELFNVTRQLVDVQQTRLAALLDTTNVVEKHLRSLRKASASRKGTEENNPTNASQQSATAVAA
jgi:hypothetical protein